MKKKISILGCGWVGYSLGCFLQSEGYDVKGSSTSQQKISGTDPAPFRQYEVMLPQGLLKGGVNAFFDCDSLIITIPPDLHKKSEKRSLSCYIRELIEHIIDAGVKSIIYLGSTAVYGEVSGLITEETIPVPAGCRAENLLYIEDIVRNSQYLSATILRCAGLAGYNRDPGKFLAGKTNMPNPDLPVNILHRDDCIAIIEKIIRRNNTSEIYNLCSDLHPTRKDFYVRRAQKLGETPPTFSDKRETADKIISNEKVKRHLDYRFKYPDPMKMP